MNFEQKIMDESGNRKIETSPSFQIRQKKWSKERVISLIAFVAGFIFDGVTLTRVNLNEASVILGVYLFVIALCIITYNSDRVQSVEHRFHKKAIGIIPYVIQFMYGTLFNASLIFYAESAELIRSWPFILFLTAVVIINEALRTKQNRLTFQITMFFIALFLYMVYILPLIFGQISAAIFVLSGLSSVAVLVILSRIVAKVAKARFFENRGWRVFFIGLSLILFNVLYFTDIIPPIPLSLKDAGVYHSVQKISDGYRLTYEPAGKYYFWRTESKIFHKSVGESAYVWSAVFAPGAMTAPIYHDWLSYDDSAMIWKLSSRISFPIYGGRDEGYRGYSVKENIAPGKWKVEITTGDGRHLGSVGFNVVTAGEAANLKTITK